MLQRIKNYLDALGIRAYNATKSSLLYHRLHWVLVLSQTGATRFWLGLASIGLSIFLYFSTTIHEPYSEYRLMILLAPDGLWALGFFIHGASLWYGVFTQTYNKLLLLLEGILGTVVWWACAITVSIAQQAPGAILSGACVALWLCIRYPTHWEYDNAD